jgi:N-acetylmuramoyl-L-alanine amidase
MILIYDMGHGGIDKKGVYTTSPSKMFEHSKGSFHKGSTFYEGVKNRWYGNEVVRLVKEKGIEVYVVNHEFKDTPLKERVDIANAIRSKHLKEKVMYVSEHSNATSSHSATGLQVYTSVGNTKSDVLAEDLLKRFKQKQWRVLTDTDDGDMDYEANFYVIKETNVPAVLIENLFFDNYKDACRLMDINYWKEYTQLQADWIEYCFKHLL